MSPRCIRTGAAAAMLLVLLVGTACATTIELSNGTVYSGVTIARQDASTVEIYARYGELTLRRSDIARIDGVPFLQSSPGAAAAATLRATPNAVNAAIEAHPAATAASNPHAAREAEPALTPVIPGVSTAPMNEPARPTAVPANSEVAAAASALTTVLAPGTWQVWWPLVAIPLAAIAWLASVRRVWREAGPGVAGRLWVLFALAVPLGGYLLFELVRLSRSGAPPAAPESIHEFLFLDANHQPIMIQPGEVGSGLENAKGVLQAAILDRASDVHIEPGASEFRVRFRIDGVLHPKMALLAGEGLRMVAALKNVAQLDISDRRKAQDGRFGGRAGGREVDFRAATTPTVHGEKLVLRILDQKSGVRGLADLGMTQRMMERFAEVIQYRSGMILATGPTGSGKTSTLYAALTQLDAIRLNIVTIEDPVEYELSGATQIPVNVKAGITYESGLRSILRQDPDVILVGEMRDLEAAQIALRSALTGHLVFSSLHSRDAIGTIHRLEELGIERHLLASALLVVLSQRLVRVLCAACRRPVTCEGTELGEIGIELPAGSTIYLPGGCARCESTGYLGRTGMFEMLILDEQLRQEVNDGKPEDEFARSARAAGYRDYREDGAEKVLLGITSAEEVLKAI